MKIATWNVNSIRSRSEHLTQWLQTNPVTVLCLQETKVIDADFPTEPFEELGYHLYFSGQKSYNGVAIFSQSPLEEVTIGFTPILGSSYSGWDEQKRVISGVLDGIRIVNVYVPNGAEVGSDKYDYKLQWLEILGKYLQNLLDKNPHLCICGDFNIALEARDIYKKTKDTDIMASPRERAALSALLELGLQDAFRKFTPDGGHYTWWDYRRGGFENQRGWRIDHHYLTAELYNRCSDCIIDTIPRGWEKPSDHTPVILTL
ncbi:MAG: exodeoxyribonuclease III [Oscillatoriaceae cyanobacterium]